MRRRSLFGMIVGALATPMAPLVALGKEVEVATNGTVPEKTVAEERASGRHETHWIGPRGRWHDPEMWSNGIPWGNSHVVFGSAIAGVAAVCYVGEDQDALCGCLTIEKDTTIAGEGTLCLCGNVETYNVQDFWNSGTDMGWDGSSAIDLPEEVVEMAGFLEIPQTNE